MMFLAITGALYLGVIVLGFIIISAKLRKTYVLKNIIARFSMEKRKSFENNNAIMGGYRVLRVKGFIGSKPYNLHVEVK